MVLSLTCDLINCTFFYDFVVSLSNLFPNIIKLCTIKLIHVWKFLK